MKTPVLAILSAVAMVQTAPAFAADHAFYATGVTPDGEAVFFVDKVSLTADADGTRLARVDIVFNGASAREGVKHTQSLVRVECSGKLVAPLAIMSYDAEGSRLSATAPAQGYAIPFDEAYRQTVDFVCRGGEGSGLTGKPVADKASMLWVADDIYRQFPG